MIPKVAFVCGYGRSSSQLGKLVKSLAEADGLEMDVYHVALNEGTEEGVRSALSKAHVIVDAGGGNYTQRIRAALGEKALQAKTLMKYDKFTEQELYDEIVAGLRRRGLLPEQGYNQ